MSRDDGSGPDAGAHVARSAPNALAAVGTEGAVTPTKSPSRVTTTPGIAWAALASSDASVAPIEGARRIFAYSMSGTRMSDVYWWRPVTRSRPPTCGAEVPATVQCALGVSATASLTVAVMVRPAVSSP